MNSLDPAILDTLAFAGLDEATMRQRAVAGRAGLALFEHPLSFVRSWTGPIDPDLPCLAILPDGPATIESYDGLVAALAGQFNLAVIEIPGFGWSYPRKPQALEFDETAMILVDALRALALPRCVLVGPCIQGLIAARMAQVMGDELAGLIIAQTGDLAAEADWINGALGGDKLALPFAGQVGFRLAREKISVDWWLPHCAGPNAPLAQLQEAARKVQRDGCCYALASQVQKFRAATLADDAVQVPTAILWGLADASHQQTDRNSVRRYAPRAHFEEWEGVGHFVDIEAPERLADVARLLLGGTG